MTERPERKYDPDEQGERRHCMDHGAIDEKAKGLQGQITSRLNLMIWILGVGVTLNLAGFGYLAGSLSSHDRTIQKIEDRQNFVLDEIKSIKAHYDTVDKRVDEIERVKR
jgi:hypothetical protein